VFWIGLSLIFAGFISNGIKALLVLALIGLIAIICSKLIDKYL